jgi:hypothetical protein
LPQLPQLARRSWLVAEPAPASVFAIDGELPALALDRLALSAGGCDRLTAALIAAYDGLADDGEHALCAPIARFVAELAALKIRCAALSPYELTASASADSYELAARYAVVLAASACVNVWRHNQDRAFVRDPAWLVVALDRLAALLGAAAPPPPPDAIASRLFDELVARYQAGRSFDHADRVLPGWRPRSPHVPSTER